MNTHSVDENRKPTRTQGPATHQLTPTAMWHLYATVAGNTVRLGRIVSLGPPGLQRGSFTWKADCEHWFFDAAVTDIKSNLSTATALKIKLDHRSATDSADANILAQVDDILAKNDRFEMVANGFLKNAEWIPGKPLDVQPNAFYFHDTTSASDDTRAHLIIEMNPLDKGELSRVFWVCKTAHQGYTGTLDFTPANAADLPTPAVHYVTSHV